MEITADRNAPPTSAPAAGDEGADGIITQTLAGLGVEILAEPVPQRLLQALYGDDTSGQE